MAKTFTERDTGHLYNGYIVKVVEWSPGKWWVVAVTGADGSYTPLAGDFPTAAKAEEAAEGFSDD